MKPTDTYSPFSNGFEYQIWLARNCERGKGCRSYNPNASTSRDGCPMEVALSMAACSDGTISAKHGLRAGLLEPGPRGLLVAAEGDASTWRCPEYRDKDEPDDRPRRRPRPPEGQIDLLDPRSQPDLVREFSRVSDDLVMANTENAIPKSAAAAAAPTIRTQGGLAMVMPVAGNTHERTPGNRARRAAERPLDTIHGTLDRAIVVPPMGNVDARPATAWPAPTQTTTTRAALVQPGGIS